MEKDIIPFCDPNLKIRNVFANFSGSTHNSFIWRNSEINRYMQEISENVESVG